MIAAVEVDEQTSAVRPDSSLPRGTIFWRVMAGGVASNVWQFFVGSGTPVDSSGGTLPDFNGDGFGDVAVGSANRAVYVYYGSEAGLGLEPTVIAVPASSGNAFGALTASGGDLNGDGFTDLLVGAAKEPLGGDGSKLFVFVGSPEGIVDEAFSSLDVPGLVHNQTPEHPSGSAMRGGADINQDGYGDFVLTTRGVAAGAGSISVYFGSASKITPGPVLTLPGETPSLSSSIALCDVDADGQSDLIVGAPGTKDGEGESTPTLVYVGSGTDFALSQSIPAEEAFGRTVACGDYQNDGYPDVAAGGPESEARGYQYGDVLLYPNSGAIRLSPAFLPNLGDGSYRRSGEFMSSVGDMNGDGYQELAVGSAVDVRVLFSVGSSVALDTVVLMPTEDDAGSFGVSLTSTDVNGDALVDLIIGSPGNGPTGRITVLLGQEERRFIAPSMYVDGPSGSKRFGTSLASSL